MHWVKDHNQMWEGDQKLESYWVPKLRIGKEEWDLNDDSKTVGDDIFVHLRRGCTSKSGLSRLVLAASNGAYDRPFNLSASKGYNELLRLRSEAIVSESLMHLPKWQRDKAIENNAQKKQKRKLDAIRDSKSRSICVTFGANDAAFTVDMLRPGKPADDIWVKASFGAFSAIIKFLVTMGMDVDRTTRTYVQKGKLPQGCRRVRGDRIAVPVPEEAHEAIKNAGKKIRKTVIVPTIEEAAELLDDPTKVVKLLVESDDDQNDDVDDDAENQGPNKAADCAGAGADNSMI